MTKQAATIEIELPEGWELTGEFRVPAHGDFYIHQSGVAPVLFQNPVAGPRFIIRRKQATQGIVLIANERMRQVTEEGWSHAHDDSHKRGELARAAEAYLNAMEAVPHEEGGFCIGFKLVPRKKWPAHPWPWDASWWKPSEDHVRNLVKAGALIAAEIDRLQRQQAATK